MLPRTKYLDLRWRERIQEKVVLKWSYYFGENYFVLTQVLKSSPKMSKGSFVYKPVYRKFIFEWRLDLNGNCVLYLPMNRTGRFLKNKWLLVIEGLQSSARAFGIRLLSRRFWDVYLKVVWTWDISGPEVKVMERSKVRSGGGTGKGASALQPYINSTR